MIILTYPFSLLVALRLVRLVRITRILWERQHLQRSARQFVSQNKRRYQQNGFDLDLTYVTPRVIAMSFPSTGRMSMYRNDIKVGKDRIISCVWQKENKYLIPVVVNINA